jgi:hypothetical protein
VHFPVNSGLLQITMVIEFWAADHYGHLILGCRSLWAFNSSAKGLSSSVGGEHFDGCPH